MIIWGMLFVFNMIFFLWTKSLISLFLAGFMLGGCLIMLFDTPHMNWQSDFIDHLMKSWRQSIEELTKQTKRSRKKK